MSRPRRWRRLAAVVAVLLSTTALAPHDAVAASCSGKSHDLVLSSGAATPGIGLTTTSFRFTVTYADTNGCAPDGVEVDVQGIAHAMTFVSGDLKTGALYEAYLTLPVGTWTYLFIASSGFANFTLTTVSPSAVSVVAPSPPPTPPPPPPPPPPTPKATPKPTPRPTPKPTPAPTPDVTIAPVATPTASPEATPGPPSPAPTPPPSPTRPPASPSPTSNAGAGPIDNAGGSDSGLGLPLGGGIPRPLLALLVASIGSAGGLGLFFLLGNRFLDPGALGGFRLAPILAGRTRRRREQPAPARPAPEPVAAAVAVAPVPEVAPLDPSATGLVRRESIRFDKPPRRGVERCHVASRLVPLHAELDPLSPILARLDIGDEVEVLRQEGSNCLVRTPNGAEGWLPGLSLTSLSSAQSGEVEP